jgi:hypothetical protein
MKQGALNEVLITPLFLYINRICGQTSSLTSSPRNGLFGVWTPNLDWHTGKLTFYGWILKSIECVELVRKAADDIRITIFFTSFGIKKTNVLVVTSNKLTNNFAHLVTSGLGPMWFASRQCLPRWRKSSHHTISQSPCCLMLLEAPKRKQSKTNYRIVHKLLNKGTVTISVVQHGLCLLYW